MDPSIHPLLTLSAQRGQWRGVTSQSNQNCEDNSRYLSPLVVQSKGNKNCQRTLQTASVTVCRASCLLGARHMCGPIFGRWSCDPSYQHCIHGWALRSRCVLGPQIYSRFAERTSRLTVGPPAANQAMVRRSSCMCFPLPPKALLHSMRSIMEPRLVDLSVSVKRGVHA